MGISVPSQGMSPLYAQPTGSHLPSNGRIKRGDSVEMEGTLPIIFFFGLL